MTYHRQVTIGVMTRTVSSLTSVKKRRRRSVEATSKNKEIEKRRKTLVNSHATLTARLTEQWELRKHSCKLSPANSHRLSSSFDPSFTAIHALQYRSAVRFLHWFRAVASSAGISKGRLVEAWLYVQDKLVFVWQRHIFSHGISIFSLFSHFYFLFPFFFSFISLFTSFLFYKLCYIYNGETI